MAQEIMIPIYCS